MNWKSPNIRLEATGWCAAVIIAWLALDLLDASLRLAAMIIKALS